MTLTAVVTHRCPFVDEVDVGTVILEYPVTDDEPIELHALAEFLRSFHEVRITHEAMTQRIADRYPTAVVTSKWATAGIEVECRAVPGDRVRPDGA